MDQELRELAEKIAAFIRLDEQLAAAGHVNVVVEDKADAENEIAQAIGQLGVLVLVIVSGFTRKQNSGPVLAGTVRVEIRCYEHPSLNRDGTAWTAQHVTERLIRILHVAKGSQNQPYDNTSRSTRMRLLRGNDRGIMVRKLGGR